MMFDFEFACDQLNFTNHSLLLEVSSSASCQHILTMCIRSCTYMDTLLLKSPHVSNFQTSGLPLRHFNVWLTAKRSLREDLTVCAEEQ